MCEKKPYCNRNIDECIRPIVDEINQDPELRTLSSCCGHRKFAKTIVVKNIFINKIYEYFSGTELGERKRNRYYRSVKIKLLGKRVFTRFYYIPEVQESDQRIKLKYIKEKENYVNR